MIKTIIKIPFKILKELYHYFDGVVNWRKSAEEAYYSSAADHADLERRMRQVDRGQAPWQKGLWS